MTFAEPSRSPSSARGRDAPRTSSVARRFWRRSYIVLVAVALAMLGGAVVLDLAAPKYAAQSLILLDDGSTGSVADAGTIDGQLGLLRSPSLAKQVIDHLDLNRDPEFNADLASPGLMGPVVTAVRKLLSGSRSAADAQNGVIGRLLKHTIVYQIGTSHVIAVEVTADTPAKSLIITNALAAAFIGDPSIGGRDGATALDARIVGRAWLLPGRNAAHPAVVLGLAAGGALVIGLLIMWLLEIRNRGFSTIDALERATELDILGIVPRVGGGLPCLWAPAQQRPAPPPEFADAWGPVQTALLVAGERNDVRTILIVSAGTDEGKTTAALNLARLFAAGGRKTILVDADMREPQIHKALELGDGPGLDDILAGKATVEDVLLEDEPTGLAVLRAGTRTGNPATLVASKGMDDLLAELREGYDVVIIDTAPVNDVADARALFSRVDMTILTLRWGLTRRRAVAHAIRLIRSGGGRIGGILLSMADTRRLPFYVYGGYPETQAGAPVTEPPVVEQHTAETAGPEFPGLAERLAMLSPSTSAAKVSQLAAPLDSPADPDQADEAEDFLDLPIADPVAAYRQDSTEIPDPEEVPNDNIAPGQAAGSAADEAPSASDLEDGATDAEDVEEARSAVEDEETDAYEEAETHSAANLIDTAETLKAIAAGVLATQDPEPEPQLPMPPAEPEPAMPKFRWPRWSIGRHDGPDDNAAAPESPAENDSGESPVDRILRRSRGGRDGSSAG